MRLIVFFAAGMSLAPTGALAQDKLDFSVGGLKWRCQYHCNTIVGGAFVKVEQTGNTVTFTDSKGKTATGTAATEVHLPVKSKGPSLRCQMNPSYCGKEPPPKKSYYRRIEIPDWKCTVSVQEKDGEPDTPPPFKAKWLRFATTGCAMGTSIWTSLSPGQVKAIEKQQDKELNFLR
jgi:hypothetical protein